MLIGAHKERKRVKREGEGGGGEGGGGEGMEVAWGGVVRKMNEIHYRWYNQ